MLVLGSNSPVALFLVHLGHTHIDLRGQLHLASIQRTLHLARIGKDQTLAPCR